MARINIEDSLFKDRRYQKLLTKIGCEYKALGLISTAWILAQENWLKHGHIPKKAWPEDLNVLIEVELAERTSTDDVYVKGSKKAFKWLEQRSAAGKSKSEKKTKTLKKTPNVRTTSDDRGSNGSNPLTLSLTHTLTHTLDDNLISNEIKAKAKPSQKVDENLNKKTNLLLAKYCLLFKQKYNSSFKPTGKMVGIAKRLAKDFTEDKMQDLLEAFFQLPDSYLVKRRHPIELLEQKLNEVLVFMETGNFVTQRTSQQMDDMATNMSLLNKIRSNGNE